MSLLMDVLRKLRAEKRKGGVYPLLKSQRGRKILTRKDVVVLGVLFTIAMSGTYTISELFLIEKTPEERGTAQPEKKEPPKEPEPVPSAEPETPTPSGITTPRRAVEKREEVKEAGEESGSREPEKPPPREESRERSAERELRNLILTADRLFREGRLRESLSYYERAFALSPFRGIANNLLVVYARLGLHEKAESVLDEFADERLVYSYAVELSRAGYHRRALRITERFIHLDTEGFIHFARGYVLETMGRLSSALGSYRKAYESSPENPYFGVNYARLLEANGDLGTAYDLYLSLRDLELSPQLRSIVEERLSYLSPVSVR